MKKLLILLLVLCTFGCKKYVVSFEQPTNMKLDSLKLEVFLDKKKIKDIKLKATNEMPTYETEEFSISDEGKHLLEFKTKDTVFTYEVKYPDEKFIKVTAHLKDNKKIYIGILKQNYKFRFQ
ncbi:hypothetical protein [Flavobacterium denitrificans]|uniref:hypothetical protein n=1 Tax=Flavobacterium denitrificans TaxID=281361 RepID=UPI0003FAAF37|nr:hypothetical protein [Flavobacterium denitrificans]